jgi:hypothetical protein
MTNALAYRVWEAITSQYFYDLVSGEWEYENECKPQMSNKKDLISAKIFSHKNYKNVTMGAMIFRLRDIVKLFFSDLLSNLTL